MSAPALGAVLAGVAGTGLLVSCVALAGSGRINFQGAVTAPTCDVRQVEGAAVAMREVTVRRVACQAAAAGGDPPPVYRLRITTMPPPAAPGSGARSDRDDGHGTSVWRLITRTYE